MKTLVYLVLLSFPAIFGCYTNQDAKRDKLPHVKVSLGKSINLLEGKKWPTHTDGRLFEAMLIQEPCNLLIEMPSGNKLIFDVRNADLHQEDSVISDIKIRMPVEPVDYQEAITQLDTQYSKLTRTRDPDFSKAIENWKSRNLTPGWPESRMTRVNLENNVSLELGIETVYYKGADKWVFFLTFYQSD